MTEVWIIEFKRRGVKEPYRPDFIVSRWGGEWARDYAIRARQVALDKDLSQSFTYRASLYRRDPRER